MGAWRRHAPASPDLGIGVDDNMRRASASQNARRVLLDGGGRMSEGGSGPQTTISAYSVRWAMACALSQNHAVATSGTLLALRTPRSHSVECSLR